MRDLSFLHTPKAVDNHGVATTDPVFNDITRQIEDGQLKEAGHAIETLLSEGVYDIRLLTILLYITFCEEGVSRLAELFSGLSILLQNHSDKFGPSTRRETHIKKSLIGLLERIERKLNYHIEKRDDIWIALNSQTGLIEGTLEALECLLEFQPQETQASLEEPSSKLRRTLRELIREDDVPFDGTRRLENTSGKAEPTRRQNYGETVELQCSPKLMHLLAKLDAFEVLARRNEFRKAALVAADVQETIESFDPREYFPELFASFGGLVSQHVENIAPFWEHKDSVSWKMLQQFYQVDLAAFVGESADE